MQRILFHNRYDKDSVDLLNSLEGQDVKVYDVFGSDKNNLPTNIKLIKLPYMIDKYIYLISQGPFQTGNVLLQLKCYDYNDNEIQDNVKFRIEVDGKRYEVWSDNGLIQVNISFQSPSIFKIKVTNEVDGYAPYETEVEVV